MGKTYLPKDRNLKKEHLEGLIHFARKIKTTGVNKMDFQAFDTTKMDEYTKKPRNSGDRLWNIRRLKKNTKPVTGHSKSGLAESYAYICSEGN